MSYTLPEPVMYGYSEEGYYTYEQMQAAYEAGRASRDAEVEALRADASTARTYMDGYSDGKAWALEEALSCYSPDDTATDWADKIRKLKEGL